jgi:hypothetical protein
MSIESLIGEAVSSGENGIENIEAAAKLSGGWQLASAAARENKA